jgi:hypothetical protein
MRKRVRIPIKITTRVKTRYRVETRIVSHSTSSRFEPRTPVAITCPDCGQPHNGSVPISAREFACDGCGRLIALN